MKPIVLALISGLLAGPALAQQPAASPSAPPSVSEQEARAIAVDSYLYFYPLITMDVTRKQLTNMEPGTGIGGPMNAFVNVAAFPSAEMKAVVRPNFDTLYSSAWLDLTKEPMVLTVPDTGGRYYLMPMLDMWTDVFASPGWRTTGTQAGNYLITPPGWSGTIPAGMTRLAAPTPYAWIIGRTKTDGPADYEAVHKIQAGYKIIPLSGWGQPPKPVEQAIDPNVDVKTPPKIQVDTMAGDKYFTYAAELLKLHPPHDTDQPIIARMRRIGMEPGKSLDFDSLAPSAKQAIMAAPQAARKLMAWKVPTLARAANHWSMNTDTMGVYGNYYLKRAIVSQLGLGANLPEDAIYPLNLGDEAGRPLNGTASYTISFEKGDMPPADAFWSITLYDPKGFQVANPMGRFALSSWMPLKVDADGSMTLHVQNESPGPDREANWLPAPKGSFNLTMRLYAPKAEALTGRWNPPPVNRQNDPALLSE